MADSNEGAPVEGDESRAVTTSEGAQSTKLFHAASGAVILGVDWLLFSGNIATGGLATLLSMLIGFSVGGLGTGLVQHFVAGDSAGKSALKALTAGILVGLPTPVAGTALGSTILALSGLSSLGRKPKSGQP